MFFMNIHLLECIAEAMSMALQTGVSISRHYDPTEKPIATFQVGGKTFTLAQGLLYKESVEQKLTFCCYLASLMRNPAAKPQQFYQGATKQLTGYNWDEEDGWGFEVIFLSRAFHLLHAIVCRLPEMEALELSYWEETKRMRPIRNDKTRPAFLSPVAKLKFGNSIFEMSPTDESRALEALSKCLDTVLIEIANEWVTIAHNASAKDMTPAQIYEHNRAIAQEHKRFQEKAREYMGPEDEEQKVLDTF